MGRWRPQRSRRGSRGTASVEYALLLAIILGVVGTGLGAALRGVFADFGCQLGAGMAGLTAAACPTDGTPTTDPTIDQPTGQPTGHPGGPVMTPEPTADCRPTDGTSTGSSSLSVASGAAPQPSPCPTS